MGNERSAAVYDSAHSRKPSSPGENTPLLGGGLPRSSQAKTFANVFISIVGAGVLGLPYAFKRTGWATSLIMLFSVAAVTYYCMMLLVYTRRKIVADGSSEVNSFGDLGFSVCGSFGRAIVDILIILAQTGFCVGYLVFIGNTLSNLFDSSTMASGSDFLEASPKILYILGCLPFQLGLNSIKTLTHLAPLSIFADVVDLGAMGVVMVEDISVISKRRPPVEAFGGLSVFFYGMGVAAYSFEGIAMILPLESEMKNRDQFGKILGLSMAFIAALYGGFGVLGYFAFGQETNDVITSNMGPGLLSAIVKLGLCINLFFTMPLMMNPAYEIIERRFSRGRYCFWLRWLLVVMATLMAIWVPNFTDFLSLVGSGLCCSLGFVVPAFFHLLVFKDEMGWKGWCLDLVIVVSGIVLGVAGTVSAVEQMYFAN
ncbi:amino acid transporter AVT3B-like [Cucurbita pepo subsp. pepo]|uniref:amino acid transporter AVT3B-like n=1 Tax=Cucurbita pepo subsp. pepo TaxID=3664 RepID=UPI000C9D7A03|nr:amino acid transporter AVT3B-like [Cucurbita pepo subsp. pepo]